MNMNNGDFYYVRLRQQTLSLGSVDLRQQNNLFNNYCKPPLSNLGYPLDGKKCSHFLANYN